MKEVERTFLKNYHKKPGPAEPNYPFGTCIEDMYSHSWSDRVGLWLWVPKGAALVAEEKNLGYPARRSEIQRFGWSAKRIFKVTPRRVDGRSFAEVVKMDKGWDSGTNRGRGPTSRPGRGSGRFRGSQFSNNRSEHFEKGEPYTRGRFFGDNDPEGYRGYGGNADPPHQTNNKRHFDEREKMEREEQDLRAKLRREQEDQRHTKEARRPWSMEERELRGKAPGTHRDHHCFNSDDMDI